MEKHKDRFERWFSVFDWFEKNPDKPLFLETDQKKKPSVVRTEFYWARNKVRKDGLLKQRFGNACNRTVKLADKGIYLEPGSPSLDDLISSSLEKAGD